MSPIDDAIDAIELRARCFIFVSRCCKTVRVDRSTLSRRHQGKSKSIAQEAQQRQLLNPQQEAEIVDYIERCTRSGLPPTRQMIKNFASAVAKWDVGEGWVTRFLHRQHDHLTPKWTRGIDRARHVADSKERYEQYFELLHSKMQQYEVAAENVYNMDEKGFMMGIIARSKRVFTRAIWEQKERTAAIQDGNREWVTILACICGDGSSLPPALIYEGKAGI
ncbi:hypothetical protein P3342_003670 [Pyrenophora teres f. teres]|nr:hypothetical protein P3342_003670 [Pyrenophora teres f. teres]